MKKTTKNTIIDIASAIVSISIGTVICNKLDDYSAKNDMYIRHDDSLTKRQKLAARACNVCCTGVAMSAATATVATVVYRIANVFKK